MIESKCSQVHSIFFAKLNFSSHCKRHKWWSCVKTFWLRLCLNMSNISMEMSDFTWQHQKYASPVIYVVTLVRAICAYEFEFDLQRFLRYFCKNWCFRQTYSRSLYSKLTMNVLRYNLECSRNIILCSRWYFCRIIN